MIFLKLKISRENLDNLFIYPVPNFECHSIFPLGYNKNPRGKHLGNFPKIKKNIRNSQNAPKPDQCNAKGVCYTLNQSYIFPTHYPYYLFN